MRGTPPFPGLRVLLPLVAALGICDPAGGQPVSGDRLNVLLITADDLNQDSLGAYGCRVAGITPHLDRLCRQGLRFTGAHVTIAVCQPCRAVWMTGRYPHRNGARGFEPIRPGVPTLLEALKRGGYFTGIFAKVPHVVPSRGAAWDVTVEARELGVGRDPVRFAAEARAFFSAARLARKPFFLMANSQDPHRPFAGSQQETQRRIRDRRRGRESAFPAVENPYPPSAVDVPGFLPDLPDVRREIAEYFTSVRRLDRTVGELLGALEESGHAEDTLVMFLSDHGMAFPFAKTNCYLWSTRTPWIVRWPGKTRPGSVDRRHLVSGIDLAPTLLDILGLPALEGADGRSFREILVGDGAPVPGWDRVVTQFHRTAGKRDYPMRAVQDRSYLYIRNAWANGETVFRNESQSGLTMRAMRRAAESDPEVAARVRLFLYRVPEEFYDIREDPDALHNLAGDPERAETIEHYREILRAHLRATEDPFLPYVESHAAPPIRVEAR